MYSSHFVMQENPLPILTQKQGIGTGIDDKIVETRVALWVLSEIFMAVILCIHSRYSEAI